MSFATRPAEFIIGRLFAYSDPKAMQISIAAQRTTQGN